MSAHFPLLKVWQWQLKIAQKREREKKKTPAGIWYAQIFFFSLSFHSSLFFCVLLFVCAPFLSRLPSTCHPLVLLPRLPSASTCSSAPLRPVVGYRCQWCSGQSTEDAVPAPYTIMIGLPGCQLRSSWQNHYPCQQSTNEADCVTQMHHILDYSWLTKLPSVCLIRLQINSRALLYRSKLSRPDTQISSFS